MDIKLIPKIFFNLISLYLFLKEEETENGNNNAQDG